MAFSGVLRRIAVKISKICNDLRLLASGPRAGFNEINLPAMAPGSSIMPGKVNPVIPETVNQVCAMRYALCAVAFAPCAVTFALCGGVSAMGFLEALWLSAACALASLGSAWPPAASAPEAPSNANTAMDRKTGL